MNTTGVTTTATQNARNVKLDISDKINRIDPEDTPLQTLANYMGHGPAPINQKIEVTKYNSFDNFDYATEFTISADPDGRIAAMRPAQKTRPNATSMYYHAQDKFYIVATGQVVEVIATPLGLSDIYPASMGSAGSIGSSNTIPTGLSTYYTDRATMKPGYLCVRNTERAPLVPFGKSDIIYLGRTIYESQRIEAKSSYRDLWYDTNYVEHKEKVIIMSEDAKDMIKTRTNFLTWLSEKEETIAEFKKEIEYSLMFSERAVNYDVENRPTYHMRGLMHSINDNVSFYNPYSTDNMEALFSNFMFQHGFRYVPNGNTKIALCGDTFLYNFNQAFKEYRQITTVDVKEKQVGIDIDTYKLPGGNTIKLVKTPFFRHDTPLEHYCCVIDPVEMELRLNKNYASKLYPSPDERDAKFMIEWQGSIAFHRPEAFALLKPFGN